MDQFASVTPWTYARAFILLVFVAYRGVLFARILTGYLPMLNVRIPEALEPFMRFLYDITEPVLRVFRRLLPSIGGFDLSPILAFLSLVIVTQAVDKLLPR